MDNEIKVFFRVEQTRDGKVKLSRIIEYESGAKVMIPVIRDGSVKWFDDSKLLKPEYRK